MSTVLSPFLKRDLTMSPSLKEVKVTSRDGTVLIAEAAGDPSKPAVVFCHGFASSAGMYDRQFEDEELLRELHMVRLNLPVYILVHRCSST
jgi:hypothetical protein